MGRRRQGSQSSEGWHRESCSYNLLLASGKGQDKHVVEVASSREMFAQFLLQWAHTIAGGNQVKASTVFEAALALAENDRIDLVERLLETLGPETDGVEEASFVAELCRRSDEIDQGNADLIPWSKLKDEAF
jgi:putative addiction module component (TIGR02574 family)